MTDAGAAVEDSLDEGIIDADECLRWDELAGRGSGEGEGTCVVGKGAVLFDAYGPTPGYITS